MKKLITIISAAALVVGVGSALAFKEIKETAHVDSHSNALAKVYKSTDELVENSNVIIKAKLPNEYRKEQVSEIVFYVYDVQVDKVYNNETDQKISEGDTVEVYRVIGFDTGGGKEMADIVAPKFQELEQGEYLLFLNGSYDEDLKKHILIPNSPHQLYNSDSSKGLNSKKSVDSQFESISGVCQEFCVNSINRYMKRFHPPNCDIFFGANRVKGVRRSEPLTCWCRKRQSLRG